MVGQGGALPGSARDERGKAQQGNQTMKKRKKKWLVNTIRIPPTLHTYLQKQAKQHGVSLNFEMMVRLEQSTDRCFACGHFLDPAK
jgi:hypothetical protein